MIVLGLDTATTGCSAALWSDEGLLAHEFEAMERGQAERLNPMIGAVMARAATGFGDLAAVAVTRGPGAFTGLRIGLAAARAIGLAARVPVIGVTTFAALARAVPEAERDGRPILVAVNGKRRDVFFQMFDGRGGPSGPAGALDPARVRERLPDGPVLITGDGGPALRAALAGSGDAGAEAAARIRFSAAMGPPDAVHVAAIGRELAPGAGAGAASAPTPLYIRPPDARLPAAEDQR